MQKSRLFLCLLLGIAIVFLGLPYLSFQAELSKVVFSVAWLLFALVAISGNLIALLFRHKVNKNKKSRQQIYTHKKQKVRQYG